MSLHSFSEFWHFSLSQHRQPLCRALHFVGTASALSIYGWVLITWPDGLLWWHPRVETACVSWSASVLATLTFHYLAKIRLSCTVTSSVYEVSSKNTKSIYFMPAAELPRGVLLPLRAGQVSH